MIRQLNHVRDRVIREVDRMLSCTKSFVSFLPETEHDVLTALQGASRETLLADITALMLKSFGQDIADNKQRHQRALSKAGIDKRRRVPKSELEST